MRSASSFGIGELQRFQRIRAAAQLHLNLREAQRGAIVRYAGKLRQQILVGFANVFPAARVIQGFSAGDLRFHRSAGKLLAEHCLQVRNTLDGDFRLVV